MDKLFEVTIGHPPEEQSHVCASIELPAMPCELRDALERARIPNGGEMTLEVTDFTQDLMILASPIGVQTCKVPDLFLLNGLAENCLRMDSAELCAFKGMIQMELEKGGRINPIPRLYNLASSVDCCHVVPEAVDDASLGRFYVDGGFLPEYDDVPEQVLDSLNYAKIGREAREAEGGVFVAGSGYVVQHDEIVDAARDFVPQEPDYAVLLKMRRGEQTVTLKLPATPQEMDNVLRTVGAENWQDVTFHCADCKVPDLAKAITESGNIEQACRIARTLESLTDRQTTVYKALLKVQSFSNLDEAMEMTRHLDEYILSPEFASAEDVGLSCLQTVMGEEEAAQVLPYVNLTRYGLSMIQRFRYSMMPYGTMERRDGEPVREKFEKQPDRKENTVRQTKPQRKSRVPSR